MAVLASGTATIIHLITTADMVIIVITPVSPEIPDEEGVLQTIQAIDLHPNSTTLHQTGEVR